MTDRSQLEPIAPAEAVELYFSHRRADLSEKTLQNQRYRLDTFTEWCDSEGDLDNLNELTGRDIHRYRSWRLDDVSKITVVGTLQTFRKFLEFAAAIDAVPEGMRERVHLPNVDPTEEADDTILEADRGREVLDYLDTFEYASRRHVTLAIMWHTGCRMGTVRALDVDDIDFDARCLDVRHRPESGTPLKNGWRAERSIALGEHYCEVIADYLEHNRPSVRDDYGREPLIASNQGRLSETAMRSDVYKVTRPCVTGECPHDREPESCEAVDNYGEASKCPSSVSPHPVRRGSITKHLRDGTPQEIISERSNVTGEILEQHYDERTEREKMELRREHIEGA
ncbi:tyrosine-type recombinase/integrase [Halorubrum sp. CBA1125]|uniref:tyrosine-type recombinase/integrase n=1 Tax=Halorubrum sp. CBA1125 TaxID=2668072 RepID=UPI0012E89B75|nr:tyrosine-type recombinase/integrase [Halorubrum sp. CBA1125]